MLVKSPLNYTGDKFRLLPQILPHLPENMENFVDLFCGGGSVFSNVEANKIYVNDSNRKLIDLLIWFYYAREDVIFNTIETTIKDYELSRTNKEGYLKLRKFYNNIDGNCVYLYVLICHAFNNMFRLNGKEEFNVPFGERTFNENMKTNLSQFLSSIKRRNLVFSDKDFSSIPVFNGDVVFADPPYSNGVAAYNKNWNTDDDLRLFRHLSDLGNKGVRFFMTNTFGNNGKYNVLLRSWSENYHVIPLNNDYKGSNHHRKDIGKTQEVLITNYKKE